MCQMLYLATPRPLAGAPPHPLQIRVVAPDIESVLRATMTLPHLALVTIDGCSCAFPSFPGDGPGEYFDGLLGSDAERAEGAAYVRALLDLIGGVVRAGEFVELFAVDIGQEGKGTGDRIDSTTTAIDPETFWFLESRVHALRA